MAFRFKRQIPGHKFCRPLLAQIWLYASPVAYTLNLVPEKWRLLYACNPMVGIIEGFRWALLGKSSSLSLVLPISMQQRA